jgi:Ribbon-helix-helix domain
MSEAVRWTIKVSPETDLSLRGFLGAQGMKKGDLSKFVEDAVRWRMLDRTAQAIKDRNQDVSVEMMEAMIEAMSPLNMELLSASPVERCS